MNGFSSIHWMAGYPISFKPNRLVHPLFVCHSLAMKSSSAVFILLTLVAFPLRAGTFAQKFEQCSHHENG
jgi:hypothetical protein